MRRRITTLAVLLSFVLLGALAQSGGVNGVVVSADDGSAVIGATVLVKGSRTGAVTDNEGKFHISGVPKSGTTLVISCVGMKPLEVSAHSNMHIKMETNTQKLGEVMVVAFGKQKREAFTGSAGTLSSGELRARQSENPLSALNGKIAGLQMVEGNLSTSAPQMVIRGISSINAGTGPLIILDGQPYDGYYSDINPADVDNISVLKDAASTALYGARGANGVILITTKQAARGKAKVTLDAKWGVVSNGRVDYRCIDNPGQYYETHYQALYNYLRGEKGLDHLSAYRRANASMGLDAADGGLGMLIWSVPQGQMLIGENGRLNPLAQRGYTVTGTDGRDHLLLPDNWQKSGLRHGLRQEYNLGISGGEGALQTYANIGYTSNEGVMRGQKYERYTGRLKMDYQAKDWLKVGLNASYAHNESSTPATDGYSVLAARNQMARIYPIYIRDEEGHIMRDARGRMYDYGNGEITGKIRPNLKNSSPLQSALLDLDDNNSNAFGGQAYADVTFLKDFKATANVGIYDTETRYRAGVNPWYGYSSASGGSLSTSQGRYFSVNTQQLLSWGHLYGQHNVSVLLGHEYTRQNDKTLDAIKSGFLDYSSHRELNGLTTQGTAHGSSTVYNIEGWFMRGQYDYAGKYFASLSYRRDGSSRFHPDHRWGNFWSVGGAWIISRETWALPEWVNILKLKASIGQQGNDNLGGNYYYDFYTIGTSGGEGSLSFSTKGNKKITWETNTNINAGVEFELLKRRVRGSVEWYHRTTSDMLLWFTAPQSIGYSGYYDNVGDMVNQGVEITLAGDVIRTKNITWTIDANLALNKNEVTRLPAEKKTECVDGVWGYQNGWQFIGKGEPVNTWHLRRYAGVSADGKAQWWMRDEATGKNVRTTNYDNASYYLCGDPNPDLTGGFGTTVKAYGFDLSATFNYSIGGKAYDAGYQRLTTAPASSLTGGRLHKDMLHAWKPGHTATDVPQLVFGDIYSSAQSDRYLIDASYLALKNISVGYTFDSKLCRRLGLQALRLYVSGDNLHYWTKRKGFDPRSSLTGEPGETGYLPVRTISGGVTLTF